MGKVKQPWHQGAHQRKAAAVCAAAYADANTRCWRCGHTLAEIRSRKPKAIWTGGHLIDSDPDSPYLAECSPCNFGNGAAMGNRRRGRKHPHPPYYPPHMNTSRQW